MSHQYSAYRIDKNQRIIFEAGRHGSRYATLINILVCAFYSCQRKKLFWRC